MSGQAGGNLCARRQLFNPYGFAQIWVEWQGAGKLCAAVTSVNTLPQSAVWHNLACSPEKNKQGDHIPPLELLMHVHFI